MLGKFFNWLWLMSFLAFAVSLFLGHKVEFQGWSDGLFFLSCALFCVEVLCLRRKK